ncbi:hypothetical protein KCU88_g3531, partial [Aureobasidium melanogenum]
MISQTAPAEHTTGRENPSPKDYAGVAFYSDYDLTELLYKTPVLDSGFLPLEPEDDAQAHSHTHTTTTTTTSKAQVPPSKPSKSDGTTTPPPATAAAAAKTKSAMKPTSPSSNNKRSSERRPSFIAVSTPTVHHHEHGQASAHNVGHHGRRRHSSHSHVPMSWWPESDLIAQHHWVERDCGSADEEEEILEEEMWADCFYD